jgi:large subunit ribosomal protein L29
VAAKQSRVDRMKEWRAQSTDDLETRLRELTEERFRLRFRSATESIDNPMRFRVLRRDIARIKTVLRQRAGQAQG